jgi:hypothetical protein
MGPIRNPRWEQKRTECYVIVSSENYLHYHTISQTGEVWNHKTSLTSPLFIEAPVPHQESEQSCICVLGVSILPLSAIFRLDLEMGLTLWYLFHFISRQRFIVTGTDFKISQLSIRYVKQDILWKTFNYCN